MADDAPTRAIRAFWETQQSPATERRLLRGDTAITDLLADTLVAHGVSRDAIRPGQAPNLPGGYGLGNRRWDLLVVDDELPIAGIEVKTMTGRSFGNRLNPPRPGSARRT